MCDRAPHHIPGHCPPPGVEQIVTDEDLVAVKEAIAIATEEDPFCPMHGRASRPTLTPGLRCDCEENRKAKEKQRELSGVVVGGGYRGDCEACNVEAQIGTEEVPHPVDRRLHTSSLIQNLKNLDLRRHDDVEELILKWRAEAADTGNETTAAVLLSVARELELVYIGPDPGGES